MTLERRDGWSRLDLYAMDRALQLATEAFGQTSPNPMVGAVVVASDGTIVAEAAHRRAGLPHAERQALDKALAEHPHAETAPKSWTLYVNLEPCTHTGRTPPCVDTILEAPVGRVVAAMVDPDPRVAGAGIARLRAAGVVVDVGCRNAAGLELNHVFVARQRRGRAFVALKVAIDADGCVAAADGSPAVITGDAARRHAHGVRAGLDAVLVGVETLRRDRPRLDTRLYAGPGGSRPRRLVVDPDLRSDPEWLGSWEPRGVLFCRREALDHRGHALESVADLVVLPPAGDRLDLRALPEALDRRGLFSLLVEGGGVTHRAFIQAGLWDRLYLYSNPGLHLNGRPWVAREDWLAASAGLVPQQTLELDADRLLVFER